MNDLIPWLLESTEPWTRYRTRLDLLGLPASHPAVIRDREQLLGHSLVQGLIEKASSWPGYALKRHSDAAHPLYAISTLADFGLTREDPQLRTTVEKIFHHQSAEGPFQTQLRLYKRFGGLDGEHWSWMSCDAPTLLSSLVAFGFQEDSRIKRALAVLLQSVEGNGWRCQAAEELGNFQGPGKREDPCPIANVYALKVLSLLPEEKHREAVKSGVDMLLRHWAEQKDKKYFLFGIGTDFRKIKYPLVWYNILHVVEVLSRFSFAVSDPRFQEMLSALVMQADETGKYTAGSMYRSWKKWSFADKKAPSPWLTFLILRISKRSGLMVSW